MAFRLFSKSTGAAGRFLYNDEPSETDVKGCSVADDISRLIRYIARHYTGLEEVKEVERDAPNIPGDAFAQERERALRAEEQRADALAEAFRAGLVRSHRATIAGGDAISLDDRDPDQNRIADAMIHFLVGPGMATSRARETTPHHYIYTIWVDWPALRKVAREASIDLSTSIKQLHES